MTLVRAGLPPGRLSDYWGQLPAATRTQASWCVDIGNHLLYARADLQEIAESEFDAVLTETEIKDTAAAFYDEFPHEMHEAISGAVEYVLNQRKNHNEQDKSQGNT